MTSIERPRVLVTVEEDVVDGRWDDYPAEYARAVEAAGGEAIPFHYAHFNRSAIPGHDGVVTIGGIDVDPAAYGEGRHERLGKTNAARDAAEIALTQLALQELRPLLAICRGAQLMNVACGGSLLQHIPEREPHRGPRGTDLSGWHDVAVTPGTLLERIAGAGPLRVNSRHHQAVTPDRLASALIEAGRTDQGGLVVVEAMESTTHPFALGIQWHPERSEMFDDPDFHAASRGLFEAFVTACVAARGP